jgi:hypothetical protein
MAPVVRRYASLALLKFGSSGTFDFLCNDIARDNRFREYRMIGVDFNAYFVSSFGMDYYDILSQRELV